MPDCSSRRRRGACYATRGALRRTSPPGSCSLTTARLDFAALAPDFLYISHLHRDHFDPVLLSRAVAKSTTVLLPEFPTTSCARLLAISASHSFVETQNGEPVELGGLRVMITAMVSPSDGPIGDSALSLDDGETRVLNQNDARPPDPAQLNAFGAYDGHFLQFSGAIWWPVVYELPEANKIEFAKRKRLNGMERARRFVDAVGARYVFPTAGPPCFLDENLFEHNDFENSPDNIFPDQRVFLAYLAESGLNNGRLLIPGSIASLTAEGCEVVHPLTSDEISSIFSDKTLLSKGLCRPTGAGSRARARIVAPLRRRPAQRPQAAVGAAIGVGRPHLRRRRCPRAARPRRREDPHRLHDGKVRRFDRRRVPLPLHDRPSPGRGARRHARDRLGEQPVFVHAFQSQTPRSLQRVRLRLFQVPLARADVAMPKGWYAEQSSGDDLVRLGDYMVQRRCPHLKADLSRFGTVCDGVLECAMHGWRFDLAIGPLSDRGRPRASWPCLSTAQAEARVSRVGSSRNLRFRSSGTPEAGCCSSQTASSSAGTGRLR